MSYGRMPNGLVNSNSVWKSATSYEFSLAVLFIYIYIIRVDTNVGPEVYSIYVKRQTWHNFDPDKNLYMKNNFSVDVLMSIMLKYLLKCFQISSGGLLYGKSTLIRELTEWAGPRSSHNLDQCWTTSVAWWRNQMKTFSALLVLCEGNPAVLRWIPFTKASDAELWCFLWLCLNKRLSKQPIRRWFETPPRPLWRHCNGSRHHKPPNYGFQEV